MIMRNKKFKLNSKKQEGATLFSVMTFLMLMTTIGISSSKLAILDILVASNDQKQMENYQQTSNELKELTSVVELYEPLINETFDPDTGIFVVPDSKYGVTETITDFANGNSALFYACHGFDGKAISLGPDVSRCYQYEFDVNAGIANSGVRDRHVRGAGKEKPSTGKNSYLN